MNYDLAKAIILILSLLLVFPTFIIGSMTIRLFIYIWNKFADYDLIIHCVDKTCHHKRGKKT